MTEHMMEFRPPLSEIKTFREFDRWYWPVADMQDFCREKSLPYSGLKAELRHRISCYFRGAPLPQASAPQRSSWARMDLTRETVITSDISFGRNVRGFFQEQIGENFVCSSDFMKWVKSHQGHTLGEAIEYWHNLNERVSTPGFRRKIDRCNNYLQYLRDIRDANPHLSQEAAKHCWSVKSRLPAQGGYVNYHASDVRFVDGKH